MLFVALFVTGVTGAASQFKLGRSLLEHYIKLIFFASVLAVFSLSGFIAFRQYQLWLDDPVARFLIPPHQDVGYFAFYSFTHFLVPYLTPLLIALLLLAVALRVNRKTGGIFFEKGEPYLAALSLFLVGHPGWLIYLVALISVYFILHTSNLALRRQIARLPLYRLWAPIAFFVILLSDYWLSRMSWWQSLLI